MEENTVTPELECLVCHSHFLASLSACPRCGTGTRLRSLEYLEKLVTGNVTEPEEPAEQRPAESEKEADQVKKGEKGEKGGFLKRGKR
jgi:hypothetical protein